MGGVRSPRARGAGRASWPATARWPSATSRCFRCPRRLLQPELLAQALHRPADRRQGAVHPGFVEADGAVAVGGRAVDPGLVPFAGMADIEDRGAVMAGPEERDVEWALAA